MHIIQLVEKIQGYDALCHGYIFLNLVLAVLDNAKTIVLKLDVTLYFVKPI